MKRAMAGILACALSLAMSITAYASESQTVVDTTDSGTSITITDITPREESNFETQEIASGSAHNGHYPVEVQTTEENGVRLLVKTFVVSAATVPETLVEEGLTHRGVEYQVSDILRQELEGTNDRKTVSETVTVSAETDKKEEVLPLFSPTLPYNEDGFVGTLTLNMDSITVEAVDTENYSSPMKEVQEYDDLTRNDPAYVQKTIQKNGVTLQLADIEWVPMATPAENSEVPSLFKAVATYTGTGWGSKATEYLVTATYTGEVTHSTPGEVMVSVVYEEIVEETVVLPPTDTETDTNTEPVRDEKQTENQPFDWTPVIVIVLVAGGITGAVLGVCWWLRNRPELGLIRPPCVMERGSPAPQEDRQSVRMPEILNEMDRGLEE